MGVGVDRLLASAEERPARPRPGARLLSALDDLVRSGRIERVVADAGVAAAKLEEADRHLRSSLAIRGDDPEGSYALLYAAARKAIDAHMAANGYRASKSRPGAHEAVARYARLSITGEYAADAKALDRMRVHRNRAEYGSWHISAARLKQDHEHARRIVEAVRRDLGI